MIIYYGFIVLYTIFMSLEVCLFVNIYYSFLRLNYKKLCTKFCLTWISLIQLYYNNYIRH